MTKYIRVPFADSGDKADVPVASASDGSVSFVQGYPIAYSLDPETDTAAKRIERTKMNFLFNQITAAIQEIQQNGVAPYITAADNGGTAYSYGLGAMVMYNGVVYQSLTANNTQLPTVAANWSPVANAGNSVSVFSTNVTGDLNAVIATGIYSVTAAATNGPLAQTAVLEVYQRSSGAVVQIWHSASATASVQNRHYIRTGVISAGVATSWSAWTQQTLRPVELSSGQDINTLTESGIYLGAGLLNAPPALGRPTGSVFIEVTMIGGGASIRQRLHVAAANTYWIRTYAFSAWTAWKQIVTSDDNPGRLLNTQVITATGTYAPTAGTKNIIVEMVGAGAGGMFAVGSNSTTGTLSGGGGSGSYAKFRLDTVPASVSVTVGAGGTSGNAGGQTVFGIYCTTPGGSTGNNSSTTGTTAVTAAGGQGGAAPTVASPAVAIITTAGESGDIATASRSTNGAGGTGGSTPLAQGGWGNPNGPGFAAGGYGSGGGGSFGPAGSSFTTTIPGGAGGGGAIIVYEYA